MEEEDVVVVVEVMDKREIWWRWMGRMGKEGGVAVCFLQFAIFCVRSYLLFLALLGNILLTYSYTKIRKYQKNIGKKIYDEALS